MGVIAKTFIKQFVQGDLGCKCPEEVFQDIESSLESSHGISYQRILTGQRLLVYVADLTDASQVSDLTRLGCSERDVKGFNRFRLAAVGDYSEHLQGQMLAAHEAVADGDPKLHLHLLSPGEVSPYTG